jgi:predicted enzyme related to lactoylglutathione lyase
MSEKPPVGTIGWVDLTVPDAAPLRDFYQAVAGWTPQAVDMGDYADYGMAREDGTGVAGICHARGSNAYVPPHWVIYIIVADLDASLSACTSRGGTQLGPVREMGPGQRFCLIRDPAGAVAGLFQA